MRSFVHFRLRSVFPRFDTREACRGSTVILGITCVLGGVTAIALLLTRLAEAS